MEAHDNSSDPDLIGWFFVRGDAQEGPLSYAELSEAIAQGKIDRATMVWKQGQLEWLPASDTAIAPLLVIPIIEEEDEPEAPPEPAKAAAEMFSNGQLALAAAISAAIGGAVEAAKPLVGVQYGLIYGVVIGLMLHSRGIFTRWQVAIFTFANLVGYSLARSHVFGPLQDHHLNNTPIASPFELAFVGSLWGSGTVLAALFIMKARPKLSLGGLSLFILFPAIIEALALDIALGAEQTHDDWPTNKGLIYLLHVPWQVVFTLGLGKLLRR